MEGERKIERNYLLSSNKNPTYHYSVTIVISNCTFHRKIHEFHVMPS